MSLYNNIWSQLDEEMNTAVMTSLILTVHLPPSALRLMSVLLLLSFGEETKLPKLRVLHCDVVTATAGRQEGRQTDRQAQGVQEK